MCSLMMNITQTPPPPLRELAADVPQGLQRIVEKLLAKKPDERFPDGQALHKALEAELRRIEGVEGVEKAAPSLSIRYQLTAVMTAVVALVSGLGVWGVHQKEREVIGQLTRDAGASLVQVIAVELAEPITVGDLVTVEVTVADIMGQESFAYLHVAGPDRIIKVSSDSSLVGRPLPEIDQVSLPGTAGVEIARTNDVEGEEALEFTAPIRYAGRNQGFVELGIDTAPTRAAFNATLTILGLAAMVITVLVGAVAYYLIGLLSKPIRTLREGLDAVAGGDLDARISHRRRDEVGGVFDAFNALAGRIAGLRDPSEARTAPMDQKPSDSMTGTLTDAAPPTDLDAVPEDATVIAPPQLASPPPDPSSGTDPAPPTADPDDPFAEPAPDDPGPDKRDDGAQ
ncbi:MAG: HAMP domain-containing protein [Maricaulaceae bacterium]